jgi:hypothetical protein
VAVSFIGGGNRRKPPTCHKSLTNFYHIMLYTSPWVGVEPTTSVVIGTDCICSCKSNYHTIMTKTAPTLSEQYPNIIENRRNTIKIDIHNTHNTHIHDCLPSYPGTSHPRKRRGVTLVIRAPKAFVYLNICLCGHTHNRWHS